MCVVLMASALALVPQLAGPGKLPLCHTRGVTMVDAFDAAAYETDRLAKDAEAMQAMRAEAEAEFAGLRTPWKWVIR